MPHDPYKALYIHLPFCKHRCAYCDFTTRAIAPDSVEIDEYIDNLILELRRKAKEGELAEIETVYLGGGTPSFVGQARLSKLLYALGVSMNLTPEVECSMEANPDSLTPELIRDIYALGVNRLSIGVQSFDDGLLKTLNRIHDSARAKQAVLDARERFENVSVDLMLGTPGQGRQSVEHFVSTFAQLGVQHISGYLLKIEPGTAFAKNQIERLCPDEDQSAQLYLDTVELMERHGFLQYEISNFALPGRESRHNLKYWRCQEYLGVGPAAHSFLDGRRFYFPRDLAGFVNASDPWEQVVQDGSGGDAQEQLMMRLRLREGIDLGWFARSFSLELEPMYKRAEFLQKHGLLELQKGRLFLTPQGFLLSNSVISDLLAEIF